MKFEIINPSDSYTMVAPDLEVAAVAVSLLGRGAYHLEGRNFEASVKHLLDTRSDELATTLESVKLTSGQRSSLNDIGGRAAAFAKGLRNNAKASD